MKIYLTFLVLILFFVGDLSAEYVLYLRDNLNRAQKGDFIVTAQNKSYSLLHIHDRTQNTMTIEEITVPTTKIPRANFSWKEWVRNGAIGNTSWVIFNIDLKTGQMNDYFSFTKNGWYDIPKQENFFSTLLNLRLEFIPLSQRRRVGVSLLSGSNDKRAFWNPAIVVDGQTIEGVAFDAWKTIWPKDGSPLADKTIEVYLPEENSAYPSYFPYWLQISGLIGKAKVRIVDSGSGLISPIPKRKTVFKSNN